MTDMNAGYVERLEREAVEAHQRAAQLSKEAAQARSAAWEADEKVHDQKAPFRRNDVLECVTRGKGRKRVRVGVVECHTAQLEANMRVVLKDGTVGTQGFYFPTYDAGNARKVGELHGKKICWLPGEDPKDN